MKNILIFGAKGSIGNFIYNNFKDNHNVIGTTTNKTKTNDETIIFVDKNNLNNLEKINGVDIVIWASGDNINDNIISYDEKKFNNIFDANVTFIMNTLNHLLKQKKINKGAKLVIISSIWEEMTRENKLSYSVSKSALSGMVKNLSYDLSEHEILINNVLPGVIDNEMTQKTLNVEQLEYIKNYMKFGRLINLNDVFNLVKFLVIDNTGITGQSIKVDLGFSNFRKYN
jgi:NAD(P)-dependent dehydrogenase (short-subunit alcohol dehydrogenase family)